MKIVSILIAAFFAFQAQANFEPAQETKEVIDPITNLQTIQITKKVNNTSYQNSDL